MDNLSPTDAYRLLSNNFNRKDVIQVCKHAEFDYLHDIDVLDDSKLEKCEEVLGTIDDVEFIRKFVDKYDANMHNIIDSAVINNNMRLLRDLDVYAMIHHLDDHVIEYMLENDKRSYEQLMSMTDEDARYCLSITTNIDKVSFVIECMNTRRYSLLGCIDAEYATDVYKVIVNLYYDGDMSVKETLVSEDVINKVTKYSVPEYMLQLFVHQCKESMIHALKYTNNISMCIINNIYNVYASDKRKYNVMFKIITSDRSVKAYVMENNNAQYKWIKLFK